MLKDPDHFFVSLFSFLFLVFLFFLYLFDLPQFIRGYPYGWDAPAHFVALNQYFKTTFHSGSIYKILWPQGLGILYPLFYFPGILWVYGGFRLFLPNVYAFQMTRYFGVFLMLVFAVFLSRRFRNPEALVFIGFSVFAYAFVFGSDADIGILSAYVGMFSATYAVLFVMVSLYLMGEDNYFLLSVFMFLTLIFHTPEYILIFLYSMVYAVFTHNKHVFFSALISLLLGGFWLVPAIYAHSGLNVHNLGMPVIRKSFLCLFQYISFLALSIILTYTCLRRTAKSLRFNRRVPHYLNYFLFFLFTVAAIFISGYFVIGNPYRFNYVLLTALSFSAAFAYGSLKLSESTRVAVFAVLLFLLALNYYRFSKLIPAIWGDAFRSATFLDNLHTSVLREVVTHYHCPILATYSVRESGGHFLWSWILYSGVPLVNTVYMESTKLSTHIQSVEGSLVPDSLVWAPHRYVLQYVDENVLDYYGLCGVYYGPSFYTEYPPNRYVYNGRAVITRIPTCNYDNLGVGCLYIGRDYSECSSKIAFSGNAIDYYVPPYEYNWSYVIQSNLHSVAVVKSCRFPHIFAQKPGWVVIKRNYLPFYYNARNGKRCIPAYPYFLACYLSKGDNTLVMDTWFFYLGDLISAVGFVVLLLFALRLFFSHRASAGQIQSR